MRPRRFAEEYPVLALTRIGIPNASMRPRRFAEEYKGLYELALADPALQ